MKSLSPILQAACVVGSILKCREINHHSCALLEALNWSRPFLDLLTGLGAKIYVFKVPSCSMQNGVCRAAELSQGEGGGRRVLLREFLPFLGSKQPSHRAPRAVRGAFPPLPPVTPLLLSLLLHHSPASGRQSTISGLIPRSQINPYLRFNHSAFVLVASAAVRGAPDVPDQRAQGGSALPGRLLQPLRAYGRRIPYFSRFCAIRGVFPDPRCSWQRVNFFFLSRTLATRCLGRSLSLGVSATSRLWLEKLLPLRVLLSSSWRIAIEAVGVQESDILGGGAGG